MGKKILNALLLVLYSGYFIFLFYRIFGERKPLDPIMMTGFIFVLFSTLLVIYLIISIYRSSYKNGSVLAVRIYLFLDEITTYLDVEFLQRSLTNYYFLNLCFYQCLVVSRSFLKNYPAKTNFFKITIFILPWIFCLTSFFVEIFLETNLFFTLYSLSAYLLIKQLFYSFLYLAQMKYYHLGIVFDKNYFPLFEKPVRNFLLLNNICMTVFLYKESGFKNKKMISYFWKLFLEMHHYRLMRGYLHIVKLTIYKPLDRFLKFINITCFAFSFILLIFKQYFILYDFLSCLWLFSLVFVIFLLFLNYLAPSSSTELRELTGQDIRLKEYLNSWFKATKVNLLKIYPFLEEKDLPDSFLETKNAKLLVYLEDAEFSNKMLNEQELAIVNKVNQRFIGWYNFELELGCIDIATSLYTPKDKY